MVLKSSVSKEMALLFDNGQITTARTFTKLTFVGLAIRLSE